MASSRAFAQFEPALAPHDVIIPADAVPFTTAPSLIIEEQPSAVRGITLAVLLSTPVWLALGVTAWLLW